MSYAVVHMQKLKMGSIRGIENHNERLKESHTNPDIDYSKSFLNKDIHDPAGTDARTYYNRIRDRIKELNLPKAVRKDAVVACGFICTSDSTFFDQLTQAEQDRFFQVSHDFLKKRYGEKNVIASTVHYDEHTPHLHCYVVPVTSDGRLSAKDIFNKVELQGLQNDYPRYMMENGFDLERGIPSEGKRKHLSEQEFKLQTQFDQVKAKKAELERLAAVDTHVPLEAEKGKIVYSTKEVEAIKEQNRALKLENYEKAAAIVELKNEMKDFQKRLSQLQKKQGEAEIHLARLDDLESENKAMQAFIKARPSLEKEIQPFEVRKANAYNLGKQMVELKTQYLKYNEARRKSIEATQLLDKQIRACDSAFSDLSARVDVFRGAQQRMDGIERELAGTTGLFKGKERKALQEQLAQETGNMKQLLTQLKTDHGIEPSGIRQKLTALAAKKVELGASKLHQIETTDRCEAAMKERVQDYKVVRTLADTQGPGFLEISDRRDAGVALPYNMMGEFMIRKGDRPSILERMAKIDPAVLEQCREMFGRQEQPVASPPKSLGLDLEWER